MPGPRMVYLNMPLGASFGWGVCGLYIAHELAKLGSLQVITEAAELDRVSDIWLRQELHQWLVYGENKIRLLDIEEEYKVPGILLQGVGDERLLPRRLSVRGRTILGYCFFENNLLRPEWIENGRRYFTRLVAGSSWGAEILKEAGLGPAETVLQGIDPTLFFPAPNDRSHRGFFADRFLVFSGGKFEYRKAQDIVIRAYKVLQDRHQDVMLINAWHNHWPATMDTMSQSKGIAYAPRKGSFQQIVNQILADNGIDLERVLTLPIMPNYAMARIYRNTDIGLFPNRCEGGTNLVLMEYMACGRPVIAHYATGHTDIVNAENALLIHGKGTTTVKDKDDNPIACWPEPDLEETIELLEWAYGNRDKVSAYAIQAGNNLACLTWEKTARHFHRIIGSYEMNSVQLT